MGQDFRVPLAPLFDAFGVGATVTRPEDTEGTPATVVWIDAGPLLSPSDPLQAADPRRVACFRRAEIATVPTGSVFTAPEIRGGPDKDWRVDAQVQSEPDLVRVLAVPDADPIVPDEET